MLSAFLFFPALASAEPLTKVEATSTRYQMLCHEEVSWQCMRPPDGQIFVVVNAQLWVTWSAEQKSYPLKDAAILVADGSRRGRVAQLKGLLLDDDLAAMLYRPYDWEKKQGEPVEVSWVFTAPASATTATLEVFGTSTVLEWAEAVEEAPDPRRVAAFDVRGGRAVGTVKDTPTTLAEQQVTNRVDLGCALVEVSVNVRAAEGVRGYSEKRLDVDTRDFALRTAGMGYIRPLEDLTGGTWPTADHNRSINIGKADDLNLLFCAPDAATKFDVLFRGQQIGEFSFASAAPEKPPAEKTGPGYTVVAGAISGMSALSALGIVAGRRKS